MVPFMVCSALKECGRSPESLRHLHQASRPEPGPPDADRHRPLHRHAWCRLVEVLCFPLPRFLLSRQMR